MKIGIIGLGKLGAPVAVAMAMKGHDVMGYDVDPKRMTYGPHPEQEAGPDGTGDYNDYLQYYAPNPMGTAVLDKQGNLDTARPVPGSLRFAPLPEVVAHGEIIFVAVQTPHDPAYEGITPLPEERVDFDYQHLQSAIISISRVLDGYTEPGPEGGEWVPLSSRPVVIISTCLPGTVRREIIPYASDRAQLVYNPFFIAMGTTMRDFLNPEFVLLGGDDQGALDKVEGFYNSMLPGKKWEEYSTNPDVGTVRMLVPTAPICRMSIESAEATKVFYNTYISQKIAFANTVMEACHKIPQADCDEVIDALSKGHERIISAKYLRGGMGDGGGCHPRDNIALSWFAQQHNLSHDLFEDVMKCREDQARWLVISCSRKGGILDLLSPLLMVDVYISQRV